jgi:MYXO-CTERM domain-containing protein
MRGAALVPSFLIVLALSGGAAADTGASAEVAALEQAIAQASVALASPSCAVACGALGSMGRAASRICAIEPGPRCEAARDKVRDATRRVREACPECQAPSIEAPPPAPADHREQRDQVTPSPAPPPPPVSTAAPASPPAPPPPAPPPPSQAESQAVAAPGKTGSCAGCVIGGEAEGAGRVGGMAALALVLLALRRRRPRG